MFYFSNIFYKNKKIILLVLLISIVAITLTWNSSSSDSDVASVNQENKTLGLGSEKDSFEEFSLSKEKKTVEDHTSKDLSLNIVTQSAYGEISSDELHEINPEKFSNIRSFNANDIDKKIDEDSDFFYNVMEIVRNELAKPRDEIGVALTAVESDEVTHAREIIEVIQEFEDQGVMVDLNELSYVRLDQGISAGIFGKAKKIDRVVSQIDDYGNEHLSMSTVPNEEIDSPKLAINTPVSAGFGVEIVSSSTDSNWSRGSRGRVIGYYQKYRDFGEQDPDKNYFAYHRWSLAKPVKENIRWDLDMYTYVATGDLKSGITNASRWKVFARTDQDPWNEVKSGSATCSNVTLGISFGAVTAESSGEFCDTIKPKWVWGGLHTRYEAKRGFFGYSSHVAKQIRNNFMVGISVKPGTTPYWWDYNDGYFCRPGSVRLCSEYTQYQ